MTMRTKRAGEDDAKDRVDRPRSAARLAAVQAIYEMDMAGAAADPVLQEFVKDRWHQAVGNADEARLVEPDRALLGRLVRGVGNHCPDLDRMIASALRGEWTLDRLEAVLRAVLRAGAYELANTRVPSKVVINEYVNVANAFFSGNEAKLVNGVLDRLARALRPGELRELEGGKRAETP